EVFGYEGFRVRQAEIIDHVCNGDDALVIMPTGAGKSMCFQLPGILFEGLTLVVSPLISLMKDQVESLLANGVEARYYNSTLSASEEAEIKEMSFSGELRFLYVSPERLFSSSGNWLYDLELSLVAIDEAHCISMWGHDFRPEYTQLKTVRKKWGQVPFIALTATADKTTRKDILEQLGLDNAEVFLGSFDRPNLSLAARGGVSKRDKFQQISRFILQREGESGIVYCLSRKDTEELSDFLNAQGHDTLAYHAGLPNDVRSKVQESFIYGKTNVVCATIAFGMGIDKSNVRFVVHSSLPKNLEGYYQEIGRSGRDGLESDTLLYYSYGDLMMLKRFVDDSGKVDMNTEKLEQMFRYGETKHCRRKVLLSYFGEEHGGNCGNCDNCLHPHKTFDGTVLAQKAMSAMVRTNHKIGPISSW
ncbi:MAG: RecQ family ATP-dependent DNA helicase, partial [Bacteroidota bacterium]